MNVAYVKIKGEFFDKEETFDFFIKREKTKFDYPPTLNSTTQPLPQEKILSYRSSIIFGENGTGKSTISKAFENYDNKNSPELIVELYDKENNVISLNKDIFVFNESYIDKNIKIEEDGLRCICMFGKQGNINERIQRFTISKDIVCARKPKEENKLSYIGDQIKSLKEKYENKLRGDDSWAGEEREIINMLRKARGKDLLKNNVSVNEQALGRILAHRNISVEIRVLSEEYYRKKQAFSILCEKVKQELPLLNFKSKGSFPCEKIKKILLRTIKRKVELTNRENQIIDLIVGDSQHYKDQKIKLINTKGTLICPYCFRDIDSECKNSIVNFISDALAGKEYDNFLREIELLKSELEKYKYSLDLTVYDDVLKKEKNAVEHISELYSKEIDNIINKLDKKKDSPYESIEIGNGSDLFGNLDKLYNELSTAVSDINNSIKEFNKAISDIDVKKEELLNINNKIAWLTIKKEYEEWENFSKDLKKQEKRVENFKKAEKFFELKIPELKSELKGYSIAKDAINRYLRYIFCDNNRLQLKEAGNFYNIISRGVKLKNPKQLSLGERNILALCFFITELNENLEEGKEFTRDILIVIDDPISSIDESNKIGLYSLTRLFSAEINKKSNSQILFLTHSLQVAYNLHRILENQKDSEGNKVPFLIRELKDKKLIDFRFKKRHEYTTDLESIFNFIIGEIDSQNIGNTLRRVLEAFSTFNYKLGIEDISLNDEILSKISDADLCVYFKNRMFKLVMNTLSHTEEISRTSINFFESISLEEQRSIAKDLVVFLYLLDNNHVMMHLSGLNINSKKLKETLDSWVGDITLLSKAR